MIYYLKCNLITWNLIVTLYSRAPSGGDQDVWRCVLLSVHLDSWFSIIREAGVTFYRLYFSLQETGSDIVTLRLKAITHVVAQYINILSSSDARDQARQVRFRTCVWTNLVKVSAVNVVQPPDIGISFALKGAVNNKTTSIWLTLLS